MILSSLMQKASSCRFLKCHADMAFPDEVAVLDERVRPAFRWVVRSRKFDRNGDDWEGEVVAAHDPGAEPRPFSSREDLAAPPGGVGATRRQDIANDLRGSVLRRTRILSLVRLRPKCGFGALSRRFAAPSRSARGTDRDIPASFPRSCSARVAGRRAACNSGGDDGSRLLIAAREDSMGKEEKLSALAAGRDLYDSIRSILLDSRARAHAAVNSAMVLAYWQIGRAIVEDEQEGQKRGAYGKGVLKGVSERLTAEFGKGYSVRNLQQMKRFYDLFPNANALRSHLTWTHYRALLRVENSEAREWYIEEALRNHWSSRQLERQISTLYYERLLASSEKESVVAEAANRLAAMKPEQFIKDPYVLEFIDLKDYPALHESGLEQALIDLKVGKLTHGDVGQMDSYIRMFDDLMRRPDDNPTIGLILCSEKNEAIAKYSTLADGRQMFASRYQFELPSVEELESCIMEKRRGLEDIVGVVSDVGPREPLAASTRHPAPSLV